VARDGANAEYVAVDSRSAALKPKTLDLTTAIVLPLVSLGSEVFLKSLDAIAVNGQLVTVVPTETSAISDKLFLKNVTLHYEFMGVPAVYHLNPERQGYILSSLRNLVDSRFLSPHISCTLPLSDVPKGHTL
jgi:NADPH:quinone reductase-like Zn-dependent oxidoreductase